MLHTSRCERQEKIIRIRLAIQEPPEAAEKIAPGDRVRVDLAARSSYICLNTSVLVKVLVEEEDSVKDTSLMQKVIQDG